jgi:myotubularin-related protein 9
VQQFACSFEFNEDFLVLVIDHVYGSEFGTFLGNCPRERQEFEFATRTTSLWSYVNRPEVLVECLNPVYEPNEKAIWPSVAAQSLELWESVYFRWTIDMKFKRKAKQRLKYIRAEQKKLRAEGDQLRIRLAASSNLSLKASI